MTQSQTDYTSTNFLIQKQYTPAAQAGQSQPATMYKRIGSTNYRVRVHFSVTSRETMNDKIMRLVKSEAVEK